MFWVCVGSSHQHKGKGKRHGMEVIICQICMCALGWNAGSTWFRITSLYASPDHKIELPSLQGLKPNSPNQKFILS